MNIFIRIKDGENGYLLPADASVSMITETLISHTELGAEQVNKMHDNAYEMWRRNFHDDKNHGDFVTRLYNL